MYDTHVHVCTRMKDSRAPSKGGQAGRKDLGEIQDNQQPADIYLDMAIVNMHVPRYAHIYNTHVSMNMGIYIQVDSSNMHI